MTKAEAKKWSIKKWEYIVNNNGLKTGIITAIPELLTLKNRCGYCEKYSEGYYCINCPISLGYECGCSHHKHPYSYWNNEPTKENAEKVLHLIKNS